MSEPITVYVCSCGRWSPYPNRHVEWEEGHTLREVVYVPAEPLHRQEQQFFTAVVDDDDILDDPKEGQ